METDVLTSEQNRKWNKNGYLVLRNVLSQQEIKNLTTVVDQMYQEYLQQSEVKPNAEFDRRNVMEEMEENDVFIPLMDHPVTFPIVFLRAFDYCDVSDELMGRCTPRQQRLIGDIGKWQPGSYFYSPPDQVQMIEGVTDE